MGEDEVNDALAQLRAMMDQAREASKEVAGALWAFYSGAKDEGFNDEQAFVLTMRYMTVLLTGGSDE